MPALDPTEYQTSRRRVAAALALSTLVGVAAFWVVHQASLLLGFAGGQGDLRAWGVFVLLVGAASLSFSPIWWLAHRHGLRQWWWALGVGVGASTAAWLVLFALVAAYAHVGSVRQVASALAQFGLSAAITSVVTWRVAYRRVIANSVDVF